MEQDFDYKNQGFEVEQGEDEFETLLFEYLGRENKTADRARLFETKLEEKGIVSQLEKNGILPTKKDASEKREEILKHLYIGAILGREYEELSDDPKEADFRWAKTFFGELSPEDEAYFSKKYPEVMEKRQEMGSEEDFIEWFYVWMERRRKERKRGGSRS